MLTNRCRFLPRKRLLSSEQFRLVHRNTPSRIAPATNRLGSVPEVAHPSEHHGQPRLVRRRDHFGVAHRSAGLDHGRRPRFGRRQQAIGKGKERVRSDRAAHGAGVGPAELFRRLSESCARHGDRAVVVHLPHIRHCDRHGPTGDLRPSIRNSAGLRRRPAHCSRETGSRRPPCRPGSYFCRIIARLCERPCAWRVARYMPLANREPSKTTLCVPAEVNPSTRVTTSLPAASSRQ